MWWAILALLFLVGCVAVFGDNNIITTNDSPEFASPHVDEDDQDEDEDPPAPSVHKGPGGPAK